MEETLEEIVGHPDVVEAVDRLHDLPEEELAPQRVLPPSDPDAVKAAHKATSDQIRRLVLQRQ